MAEGNGIDKKKINNISQNRVSNLEDLLVLKCKKKTPCVVFIKN